MIDSNQQLDDFQGINPKNFTIKEFVEAKEQKKTYKTLNFADRNKSVCSSRHVENSDIRVGVGVNSDYILADIFSDFTDPRLLAYRAAPRLKKLGFFAMNGGIYKFHNGILLKDGISEQFDSRKAEPILILLNQVLAMCLPHEQKMNKEGRLAERHIINNKTVIARYNGLEYTYSTPMKMVLNEVYGQIVALLDDVQQIKYEPYLDNDFKLVSVPGYYPNNKTLAVWDAKEWKIPQYDETKAKQKLHQLAKHLFSSFRISDECAGLTGLMASLYSSLFSSIIPCTPISFISASNSGDGKSFACKLMMLFNPGKVKTITIPSNRDEFQRQFNGALDKDKCKGIVLSNLKGDLEDYAFICDAVTEESMSDRATGGWGTRDFDTRVHIMANGNDYYPKGDIAKRRVFLIRLLERLDKDKNYGFFAKVQNSLKESKMILWGVFEAYAKYGSPQEYFHEGFEEWSQNCLAPVLWAGFPNTIKRFPQAALDVMHEDDRLFSEFINDLTKKIGDKGISSRDIAELLNNESTKSALARSSRAFFDKKKGDDFSVTEVARKLVKYEGKTFENIQYTIKRLRANKIEHLFTNLTPKAPLEIEKPVEKPLDKPLTPALVASVPPKINIEAAKKSIKIMDVLSKLSLATLNGKKEGNKYQCPFHEDFTPSFDVNTFKNQCYCFSCGCGSDAIGLAGALLGYCTFGDKLNGEDFIKTLAEFDKSITIADRREEGSYNHKQLQIDYEQEEKQKLIKQEEVSNKVDKWVKQQPINQSEETINKYLIYKKVKNYGCFESVDSLVIPLRDIEGKIWSRQIIDLNSNTPKLFELGGRTKGCMHIIGDLKAAKQVYICEGYATAATVHMAKQTPSIAAFSLGNIINVIEAVEKKYPNIKITVCGELFDPIKTQVNGLYKKIKAKNVELIFPKNSILPKSDFNDVHVKFGLEEVKKQIPEPIFDPFEFGGFYTFDQLTDQIGAEKQ